MLENRSKFTYFLNLEKKRKKRVSLKIKMVYCQKKKITMVAENIQQDENVKTI